MKKQSGETKPLNLTAPCPDVSDCTGGSRQGRSEMWLSLAQEGPRVCICSSLKSVPFLSIYWGKYKLKGSLFDPCPSWLPSLNLLSHEWFVLWLSAEGGSPLWGAPWAVLHEAMDQGGFSEGTTQCKSITTKFLVEEVANKVLAATNIWVWNRIDFGGKETSSEKTQGPP